MTYDLYDLILDLVEVGFTVKFEPRWLDGIKPHAITISIQNGDVAAGDSPRLEKIKEYGESGLIRHLIEQEKSTIIRMMEAENEPSTTAGLGTPE